MKIKVKNWEKEDWSNEWAPQKDYQNIVQKTSSHYSNNQHGQLPVLLLLPRIE